MADAEERWELAVNMPPVTEETVRVHVRCGQALVVVEPRADDQMWQAEEKLGNYLRTPGRKELDAAVADARMLAERSERQRLLNHALADALANPDGDQDE